jgi:hypothetical protein
MAQHGVDGAFLQRFAAQCDVEAGNEGIRRIRDEVGDLVRHAAEREGRVFAIMLVNSDQSLLCSHAHNTSCRYDVSGVPPNRIKDVLERDWVHLIQVARVLESPSYLKEKGKPVVALWGVELPILYIMLKTHRFIGFGFDGAGHSPDLVRSVISFFRNSTPGGAYIFGGAPAYWRTSSNDADRNPGFLNVWIDEFDAISPWTVGRYTSEDEADNFAETNLIGDVDLLKKRTEQGHKRVDYVPVVLPGGSVSRADIQSLGFPDWSRSQGFNLSEGRWAYNDIKRNGGRFLWKQIFNARRLGVRIMYGAMWDEQVLS